MPGPSAAVQMAGRGRACDVASSLPRRRAEAYVFILLVDDADFRLQHKHTIVSSFSLIVGLSSEHIVRDVTVDKTFNIPEEGGDYLVMVGVYGYSGAGGLEAFASARGEGTTEYIAVEALP